jgi:hypothetical protein
VPPKLFLHIGTHKTATTSIQFWFDRNRDEILRHGLLYPRTGIIQYAQHRLAFALKRRRDKHRGDVPDLDAEIAELREAVRRSGAGAVLISSEEFFSAPRKRIAALRARLDFCEPQVLAVVRRQDDFLLSSYDQKAKTPGNGFTRPLSHFIASPREIGTGISYWTHLRDWIDVFGADAVSLRRYEDAPPLDAIFTWLGLPESLLPRDAPVMNRSRPAIATEAVRLAKRLRLPVQVQQNVLRMATKAARGRPGYRLNAADRARIMAEFEAENDAMFAAFGMENTYRPS